MRLLERGRGALARGFELTRALGGAGERRVAIAGLAAGLGARRVELGDELLLLLAGRRDELGLALLGVPDELGLARGGASLELGRPGVGLLAQLGLAGLRLGLELGFARARGGL